MFNCLSLDFYNNGEYTTWWDKWGKKLLYGVLLIYAIELTIASCIISAYTCGAGTPLAAASVTLCKIAMGTLIGAEISLAIGGTIAGIQSAKTGHGFWKGYEKYVEANLVTTLITSFAFAAASEFICAILQYATNANDGITNSKMPPNNGAESGTEKVIELQPGKYSRYGTIGSQSDYITNAGALSEELSLPPWNDRVYTEITVLKPIPNVTQAIVAPWAPWGGVGGGTQYLLPYPILTLKMAGYLTF